MWSLLSVLVALSVFYANEAALSTDQTALIASHRKDCLAKTSVDPSVVEKIHKGELEDSPKVKAFVICFLKHLGILNDSGTLEKYILSAKINMVMEDKAKSDKIVETCAVTKSSVEETSVETVKCLFQQSPKIALILA